MKHVKPVSIEEETRYREEYSHAIRSGAYGGSALHLPDENGEEPKCDHVSREDWKRKDWEAFPMGFVEICKQCARKERLE